MVQQCRQFRERSDDSSVIFLVIPVEQDRFNAKFGGSQEVFDTVVNKVQSLPESVKKWVAENYGDSPSDKIKFSEYICMKAADGTIVNGWLASQTDMLSEDWTILE